MRLRGWVDPLQTLMLSTHQNQKMTMSVRLTAPRVLTIRPVGNSGRKKVR